MDKKIFKKTGEELRAYLQIMRKHNIVQNKKGKGSYSRKSKYQNLILD